MKKLIEWFKDLLKPSFTGAHNNPEDSLRIDASAVRELAKESPAGLLMAATEAQALLDSASGPSPSFTWREVACRDKGRTLPYGIALAQAKDAAKMMEAIRSYLGDRAITVNSWYRTPEYNRQVGGAKNSYHVKGMAVDFTVAGLTPAQVQRKLIAARDSGKLAIGGIGRYKTFTHCDIGPKRTWQG